VLLASSIGASAAQVQVKVPENLPVDDQFIIKALVANNAVIRLAELVESRSDNVKVEAFAKDIITDHKKISDKIGKLVTDRKIAVVAGVEKELRDEVERLGKLKGNEFDREYLDGFIKTHDHCLAMCKGQMKTGKEDVCSAFAKECQPTLEEHLRRARELRASLPK